MPEKIAVEARDRVARWLGETALHPRPGFIERIHGMVAALALWGAHTNLTADASDPVELAFHIMDSLAPMAFAGDAASDMLDSALAAGGSVLDLGSGGGFPGLVLAAAFDARFTLIEPRRKRASYLQVAADDMGLANVSIERHRATPRSVAGGFGMMTVRAFGARSELYEIAGAALRPGGLLLLYASATAPDDIPPNMRSLFDDRIAWRYRLPHGERIATRTGVLLRRKS